MRKNSDIGRMEREQMIEDEQERNIQKKQTKNNE